MKINKLVILLLTVVLVSCTSVPAQISTTTIPTFTLTSLPATITPEPTFTKTPFPSPTLTLVPTPTFAQVSSTRPEYDKISGTYKLDRGSSELCFLKVVLEPFTLPDHEIGFEIFCKHGPPSYSSGHAIAKITISDNIAVYSHPKLISGEVCYIVLHFDYNKVKVIQLGVDYACGFGHGIHADGVYKLLDAHPPVLGCMDDDNPCGLPKPIP